MSWEGWVEAGRFGADLLIIWESSRGSRRVGEWATLVDKLVDAGVQVHVTTHSRTYDPANPRDRRSLMEDAVDSEYQSGKASLEILRSAAATAARGEPHGRTPYGYRRRYDPVTRRLIAQEPHPAEAEVVRELFARLHKGHSLSSIAEDFGERGIRTPTGKRFTPQHLRETALRPLYGGLRMHQPGNRSGRYWGPLDGAVPAKWPALIDAEVFHGVRAMLLSPERRTTRPGRGVHLLSLIAACDSCGGPLSVSYRKGHREYECHPRSCVRINADELDAYAEEIMLAYLARPNVVAKLRAGSDDDHELSQVRADLAEARGELTSLRTAGRGGKLSVATVMEMEPGLVARVERLEARERELTTPSELAGLIEPGKDVAERWKVAPMSAKRSVARLLCSPRILGQLRITGTPARGHKVAAQDRVVWSHEEKA